MLKFLLLSTWLTAFLFGAVGEIVQSNGKVTVIRPIFNPIGKILPHPEQKMQTIVVRAAFMVERYDTIKTDSDGSARILFSDETTIMLGKNTQFHVEEYLFDESKENSKASFNVQGMFNFMTGKIGKIAPKRFSIKTKSATIGIRGTEAGCVDKAGASVCYCEEGGIDTSNSFGEVLIPKGMKSTIKPDLAPQTPVEYVELEGYAFGLLEHQLRLRQRRSLYPYTIVYEIQDNR